MNNTKEYISSKFVEYFQEFDDGYVIIGGTAMAIVVDEYGLKSRVTKDYDVALTDVSESTRFLKRLITFIEDGGYSEHISRKDGKHHYYRFLNPTEEGYPVELEIFSSKEEDTHLKLDNRKMPITAVEDANLSALILDAEYHDLLNVGRVRSEEGIWHLSLPYLIVFKAKAWLDLRERKENGEVVDSKSIKKHINDIYRLALGIDDQMKVILSKKVLDDMKHFIKDLKSDPTDYAVNNQIGIENSIIIKTIENLLIG